MKIGIPSSCIIETLTMERLCDKSLSNAGSIEGVDKRKEPAQGHDFWQKERQ
jgi:hypothetical protein